MQPIMMNMMLSGKQGPCCYRYRQHRDRQTVNAANIAKDEEIAEAPADAEVPTDIPTQEETENAHGFKVGQKVKVINAYDYYGNMFKCWYSKYDVIEVKNDRIVIGIGNTVTATVNAANLAQSSIKQRRL